MPKIVIPCYSWNPLIRARLSRITRYFKLTAIFSRFVPQSFNIRYFELPLFRASFSFLLGVRNSGVQLYRYITKNRTLILKRFSGFGKRQNPTSATAIQLHPHWYVAMPSLWPKADVACSEWRIKLMVFNSVLVCVSSKHLHQKNGRFFWIYLLKHNCLILEYDEPLKTFFFSRMVTTKIKVVEQFVWSYPITCAKKDKGNDTPLSSLFFLVRLLSLF